MKAIHLSLSLAAKVLFFHPQHHPYNSIQNYLRTVGNQFSLLTVMKYPPSVFVSSIRNRRYYSYLNSRLAVSPFAEVTRILSRITVPCIMRTAHSYDFWAMFQTIVKEKNEVLILILSANLECCTWQMDVMLHDMKS